MENLNVYDVCNIWLLIYLIFTIYDIIIYMYLYIFFHLEIYIYNPLLEYTQSFNYYWSKTGGCPMRGWFNPYVFHAYQDYIHIFICFYMLIWYTHTLSGLYMYIHKYTIFTYTICVTCFALDWFWEPCNFNSAMAVNHGQSTYPRPRHQKEGLMIRLTKASFLRGTLGWG